MSGRLYPLSYRPRRETAAKAAAGNGARFVYRDGGGGAMLGLADGNAGAQGLIFLKTRICDDALIVLFCPTAQAHLAEPSPRPLAIAPAGARFFETVTPCDRLLFLLCMG